VSIRALPGPNMNDSHGLGLPDSEEATGFLVSMQADVGSLTNHLRQWPAVHCSRLQGVHSHLWHDARPNLPLLSTVKRQDRALAQVTEKRVHSAGNAAVAGRCAASGRGLRGALQQRPPEQCHRLHHPEGRGWRGVSRRSTRTATASWRPPDSSARVTAGKRVKSEVASRRDVETKESYFDPTVDGCFTNSGHHEHFRTLQM